MFAIAWMSAKTWRTGLLLLALCLSSGATAAPVEAVALFKDRVVVRTSAGQEMIRVGQTSPGGVTLIEANTRGARVRYQGQEYALSLSARVSTTYVKPESRSVRINQDNLGQYRTRGSLNGHYVNFLVDTGASIVAMSERHAQAMGIDYRGGEAGYVETAQGTARAYFLDVAEVTIGGITINNVEATVIEGSHPIEVLLGMSFLKNVRITDDGGVMTLTAKF